MWLWIGGAAVVIVVIMVAVNVILFRSSIAAVKRAGSMKTPKHENAAEASLPSESKPAKAADELAKLSQLLVEIEEGKGQEVVEDTDVDFASVHASIIGNKSMPNPDATRQAAAAAKRDDLPSHISNLIANEQKHPLSIGWLLLKNGQVKRSSTVYEQELTDLFIGWQNLVERSEQVLAFSQLTEITLTGNEGRVEVKCDGDYMFISLREGA